MPTLLCGIFIEQSAPIGADFHVDWVERSKTQRFRWCQIQET